MLQNLMLHANLLAGGGPFHAAQNLAQQNGGPAKTACLFIAAFVVIIAGGMYIIGTPRMRQAVKNHLVGIIIGVILIVGARQFISWLQNSGSKAWGSTIMLPMLKARLATILPCFSKWLI